MRTAALLVTLCVVGISCDQERVALVSGSDSDPLPAWNDGVAKQTILQFVRAVSDPSGPSYVPPHERIATLDHDGTLWVEKPLMTQLGFVIHSLRTRAEKDPELRVAQPYKAAWQDDRPYFKNLTQPHLVEIILEAHEGVSQIHYAEEVRAFLNNATHPRFQVPYRELVYRPMLELLQLLRSEDFKVYIVSAGESGFIRVFSEEVYGIPRENVIGSSVSFDFEISDAGPVLVRDSASIEPINMREGKPVNIQLHIGRKPIFAVGNSTGDLEMLVFAEDPDRPSLSLLLRHDDPEREYRYNDGAEEVLEAAKERGWTVISIKNDFKTLFKFPGDGRER